MTESHSAEDEEMKGEWKLLKHRERAREREQFYVVIKCLRGRATLMALNRQTTGHQI